MNYYDKIARGYEELHKEEQENKIKLIKKYVKNHWFLSTTNSTSTTNLRSVEYRCFNPAGKKLLDVGCGTGITTIPWDCELYGIDPAIPLLKRAHCKTKVHYVNAEAEHIPFKDNSFDIVVSITAIQNFHDIEKGLQEIKRVGRNKFVLSFLKKSAKKEKIQRLINTHFNIRNIAEEAHDLIYFIGRDK